MNGQPEGKSLQLFFIDGRPDGMLTAQVFNWTGHVLMAPRTQITTALGRKEARYAGAYILLGEQDGEPLAYIGEGDDISLRIKSHDLNKDWWTSVVLITSSANDLHKAHAQYLEARLVERAKAVGLMKLANATNPTRPTLSEAAQADMEGFLGYLFMVLPAIRVDMFLERSRPNTVVVHAAESPVFEMSLPKQAGTATAVLEDGDFVVQAGSKARLTWTHEATKGSGYAVLHDELVKSGVLAPVGATDLLAFTTNYAFTSPSAAASVINARYSNGPTDWHLRGTGETYKAWEASQLGGDQVGGDETGQ
jgi:hypothetical protein